jgi:hypothetical protein
LSRGSDLGVAAETLLAFYPRETSSPCVDVADVQRGSWSRFLSAATVAVATLIVATGVCRSARADELRLTLSYEAPPGCPTAQAIQSSVQTLATRQTKPYSASVVITGAEQHFTARIVSSDGTERTLVGSSCAEVTEAIAVVLALAISPSSRTEATSSSTPSVTEAREATAPRRASDKPNGANLVRLKVGAAGVLDLGTLPHLDLGVSGRLGATARLWSVALDGAYFLPDSQLRSSSPRVGGDFSLWTLLVSGCLVPRDGSPRIELCAGPELGHLAGHGSGIAAPEDQARFRLGAQALVEASVPLSPRLRLRTGLGAAVVLLGRHAFELDGRELYRPQLVAGRAAIGAELIF